MLDSQIRLWIYQHFVDAMTVRLLQTVWRSPTNRASGKPGAVQVDVPRRVRLEEARW